MRYCDEIDLLSGAPIEIPKTCTILPVFLSAFRGRGGGRRYAEYRQHLSMIALTKENIIESLSSFGVVSELNTGEAASVSHFSLLISLLREPFFGALSYFVEERMTWNQQRFAICCLNEDGEIVGEINRETYPLVRRVIMESNHLEVEEDEAEMKFSGSRSKSIFEKLRKGRKNKAMSAAEAGPRIEDIISAVSVRSNGYTLLNVWGLTIYQLHDQFTRVSIGHQVDVLSSKWAAWGTEPFDFTLWYKNLYEEDKNV